MSIDDSLLFLLVLFIVLLSSFEILLSLVSSFLLSLISLGFDGVDILLVSFSLLLDGFGDDATYEAEGLTWRRLSLVQQQFWLERP
jgi:hypothetical protein